MTTIQIKKIKDLSDLTDYRFNVIVEFIESLEQLLGVDPDDWGEPTIARAWELLGMVRNDYLSHFKGDWKSLSQRLRIQVHF